MGMTIDDNVDFLNEAKDFFEDVANDPKIKESIKIYLIIESLEMAMSTMRKYQKIQQILKSLDDGEISYPQMAYYLREVLEDGSENNHHASNT